MLRLWVPIVPQHIWGKISGKAARQHVREPAADRGLGSVPGGRGQEGRVHPPRGQQALLGRRAQGRRGHLPGLPEPRDHGRRPEDDSIQAAEHMPVAEFDAALLDGRHDPDRQQRGRREVLRRARLQLLRQPELDGQPGPPRPQVPAGALLGGRQAEDHPGRLRRPRPAGFVDRRAGPRVCLAAAGQRSLRLRPGQGRPDAHRGRLSPQERRAPEQAGQAHRAAPAGPQRGDREPGRRQADHELVRQARHHDQVLRGRSEGVLRPRSTT